MLKKALMTARVQQQSNAFRMCLANRGFLTYQDKNYKVPENLDELISYLDKKRPTFTLLYFTAKWNPIIPKIEKDYEETTKLFKNFEHIRVDCDKTPMVKFYFDARVEPQFLILLNGGELRRVVGFNFEKLHGFLNEASDLHYRDFQYWGGDNTKNSWERFYDNFDRFSRQGEYDKDATKMFMEPTNDQWRGAGTQNP